MPITRLLVERDSVCAGDDVDAPHSETFDFATPVSLADAIEAVRGARYLAFISGGRATWTASIAGRPVAVLAQQWQAARMLDHAEPQGPVVRLRFSYLAQRDPEQIYRDHAIARV